MYFDLEFNQKVNEGRNVDEMVDILISVIVEALHDKYAIEGKEDWIVELDSSTKGRVTYILFNFTLIILLLAFVLYYVVSFCLSFSL